MVMTATGGTIPMTGTAPPRRWPVATVALLSLVLAACGQGTTEVAAPADGTATAGSTGGDGMPERTPPDPSPPVPSGLPVPAGLPVPSGLPGAADLPADVTGADLVLLAGGPAAVQRVTLTCDWSAGTSGGTHPQAAQACTDLRDAVQAGNPFAPVAPDAMCTQQYGGDAVVDVSGTLAQADGPPVTVGATYTLTDGCQIRRFEALGAVLAPFRGSV